MSKKDFYGDLMKTYTSGYNFVLGRFYGIINLALLASTYFVVKGQEVSITNTILIGVGALTFLMIVGYFYLRWDLVKAESKSNFVENPQNVEMLERIRKIEEVVVQLKKELVE